MTPRQKVLHWVKGKGKASAPLVFPLAYAIAAQVEALELADFLYHPTKLAKGLEALNDALEVDAILCCCAAGIEIEAAGAELDWLEYPPKVIAHPPMLLSDPAIESALSSPRLAAAIEATRRLAATARGEPALVAGVTGPMTLAGQLGGAAFAEALEKDGGAEWIECAGRLSLAVVRQFLKAGANVVLFLEQAPALIPGSKAFEAWASVIAPIANTARFHQALPVILPLWPDGSYDVSGFLEGSPKPLHACLPKSVWQGVAPHARVAGVAVGMDLEWSPSFADSFFVTTEGEIPPDGRVEDLREACQRAKAACEMVG